MQKPDFGRVKDEVNALITRHNYFEPPIDPIEISRNLGLKVYFAPFENEYEKVSGFFNATENAIYVNKKEVVTRQIFTVAHELGHKILHEEWANSKNYTVLLREQLEFPSKDFHEQEANCFAANLLVPKKFLFRYKDVASIKELAKLFMVSELVIRNRLNFEMKYK